MMSSEQMQGGQPQMNSNGNTGVPMNATNSSSSAAPAWANPNAGPSRREVTEMISSTSSTSGNGGVANELLEPYSTLDEPVMETIMRDVNAVAAKLKVVLSPLDKRVNPFQYASIESDEQPVQQDGTVPSNDGNVNTQASPQHSGTATTDELSENERIVIQQLRDWDLWGPLFVCLLLSVLLSLKAPKNQSSAIFATVFMAIWFGSAVVTLNAQLLGSSISFFQSVCVLGYCVFPMTISALIVGILRLVSLLSYKFVDIIIILIGFIWSLRASSVFIGMYIKPSRRFLALYPVLFFYTFLGWLILLF